jgi:DNA-binding winged helix-turn-helix (wHTH) protein
VIYSFGAFDLDTDRLELRRAGTPVPMEPQVFAVLAYLVEHRDRVVSKDELLDNVWGDRFVSESALTTRIKAARRAVGDDGQAQRTIKTLHGRGYRLVAPVREEEPTASPSPDRPPATPEDSWPLVGRSAELETLASWFREERAGGVLLTGGAGVGKTRLAEKLVELAEAAGLPSARAAGHPEGRAIPFAALAHLLPPDVASPTGADELDRAGVFHRARAAVRAQAGDQRLLLLIDDADQLDDLSRALVASLVQSRSVFAVLTMRTSGGPTPFDHLVKDGHLRRLTVDPLSEESIETILHRALGGPLVAGSLSRLRDLAMGNPGVLRQLVESARDAGTLTVHDGVWHLVGPIQPTPTFEDLVAERLRGLDDAHQHAAELLAVAGEIGVDSLARVVGHGPLEDLEHRGLLKVRASGRRAAVSLAHPLFTEVLLRQLPSLRARRLRGELANGIEATGARRRDDGVRLVAWRLDSGGEVAPELVLNAARLALLHGDDATAERLIERAVAARVGARASQLLGELHFRRNQPELLEGVLARIDLSELDEADRVRVVRRRSANWFYGLTDADRALAVLDDSADAFTSPEAREAIAAHRVMMLAMVGRIQEALTCSEPLLDAGDERLRFAVLRARSLALAAAGRGEEALGLVDEGAQLHDRFDPDLTRPGRSILLFNELFALTELGRLLEARALGDAAAASDPVGGRVTWLAFARPRIELLAGDAAAALATGEPYALEVRAAGAFGAERWVLSLVGMARLLAGDAEGGGRDIDRVAALWPQDHGLFRSDRDRAQGWLEVERSGPDAALEVLRTGAANARERGAFALEAMLLHDAVRFGRASAVVDRLRDLAEVVQGDLMVARRDHAAGIVAADPARLAAAVDDFERLGCWPRRLPSTWWTRAPRPETRPAPAPPRSGRPSSGSGSTVPSPPRASSRRPAGCASDRTGAEQTVLASLEHRFGDEDVGPAPCRLDLGTPLVGGHRGDGGDEGIAHERVVLRPHPVRLVAAAEVTGSREEGRQVGRGRDELQDLGDEAAALEVQVLGEEAPGRRPAREEVVVEHPGEPLPFLVDRRGRPLDGGHLLGCHRRLTRPRPSAARASACRRRWRRGRSRSGKRRRRRRRRPGWARRRPRPWWPRGR